MSNQDKENTNKSKWLILLLLLITLIAVVISVWALFFRSRGSALTPDYAPVEEEKNAESIEGDSGDKLKSLKEAEACPSATPPMCPLT